VNCIMKDLWIVKTNVGNYVACVLEKIDRIDNQSVVFLNNRLSLIVGKVSHTTSRDIFTWVKVIFIAMQGEDGIED
jgi:hypothetical protein